MYKIRKTRTETGISFSEIRGKKWIISDFVVNKLGSCYNVSFVTTSSDNLNEKMTIKLYGCHV